MRQIPDDFDPAVVEAIDRSLEAISAEQDVEILWAVESGSRAWGFPSPDSDYDCRFIYRRRQDSYLSLFQPRDVIELPLDNLLDVNGWDITKALKLLLKGNAVVAEWLTSPIIYRGDEAARDRLLSVAAAILDRNAIANHYLHLGTAQLVRWGDDGKPLKKLFYAIRPALCLRWLKAHDGRAVPPMNVHALMAQVELPASMRGQLSELIALKAKTREMGSGAAPADLIAFCEDEYAAAKSWIAPATAAKAPAIEMADATFRHFVADDRL